MRRPQSIGVCWVVVLAALGLASSAQAEGNSFRLYVQADGVYRVTYSELVEAGLPQGQYSPGSIVLRQGGDDVPIWVEAGEDSVFGAGDGFEFVGHHLAGENSHFNQHARSNVYQLSFEASGGARMRPVRPSDTALTSKAQAGLEREVHAEVDRLLIRLSHEEVAAEGTHAETPDLWYWHKLTHVDEQPTDIELMLPGLDQGSTQPIAMSARVRGLSTPAKKTGDYADHQLMVRVNDGGGQPTVAWNGRQATALQLPPYPADQLSGKGDTISFSVPNRTPEGEKHPVVDVVMLDWVQVRYPWNGRVIEPVRFRLAEGAEPRAVSLEVAKGRSLRIYGRLGSRIAPRSVKLKRRRDRATHTGLAFVAQPGEREYWAVPDGQLSPVVSIEADEPSNLRDSRLHADHLIIAHRSLLDSVRPLADFHRGNGLAVAVVDVQDIYDEFNHGIRHPRALRDFIAYAYHEWRRPAPRFVLLVGDASWDIHNAVPDDANYANWADRALLGGGSRFKPKKFVSYSASGLPTDRGLVPTWQTLTHQGQAATDNYFVAVDGDDYVPDLAIGRFPVVEPGAVEAIIDKIINYTTAEVGPWRRSALLISNEWDAYKRRNDYVARTVAPLGFARVKVYPSADESDNEHHQQRLIEAFDQGQLLVHFAGHGGRFIWRTGPPDLKKNHDLFTLDHLDQLKPTHKLPVVLSVTCHSGPFDHPLADSIAEKFLRLPGRGAVAVVAASWRTNPGGPLSTIFAEAFSRKTTIGEAFLEVKRRMNDRMLVEGYNLLGDPAVVLGGPQENLALRLAPPSGDAGVEIELPVPKFTGRIIVDWLDEDGTVLSSNERALSTVSASFSIPSDTRIYSVSAYAWSQATGWDAAGGLVLELAPRP